MIIKAPAKLNLTLSITAKRSDGYHQIETIMQTISLADEVTLTLSNKISVQTNMNYIPADERNIAYRAAALFFEAAKISSGVNIKINKKIPVGAGMGGGSSNAASVLMGLNDMFGTKLCRAQLSNLGLKLGADVPFFFIKGACIATGRGELLTPIKSNAKPWVVVVKPPFSINTKQAYQRLSPRLFNKINNTNAMVSGLERGSLTEIGKNLYNIFESAMDGTYPQIKHIKETLLKKGALGGAMTGSGSAVYGIFATEKAAQACAAYMKTSYKTVFISSFE